VVTTAARADGYTLDPTAARRGSLHVPSAIHPIHASDQSVAGHSFDFAAAHDDENLYVWIDVEEDLRCAASEEIKGRMKADNVCIFLDGRGSRDQGKGGNQDGVMRLTVYPAADESAAPQVSTSNDAEVRVELARTPVGYRVDCAVPWAVFSQVEGAPRVVGFDVVLNSYDEEGGDVLRLSWTGRTGQERDPGAFGKLLLI
jgi:hypothetical protein